MTKQRHVRQDAELKDETTVVLRGGPLDSTFLRADAERNNEIYGSFGLSVFAAVKVTIDELAQQVPLIRFSQLTLLEVGELRNAGLRLEATGRNPLHYDITFDELDSGIERLLRCSHRTTENPYYVERND
jgi:hypothetical protein